MLPDIHGRLLVVRPPVPATLNKTGASYKSEVTHLTYSPRRAFGEWRSILDVIALTTHRVSLFELFAATSLFALP